MTIQKRIVGIVLIDSVIVLFSIYLSHFFLNPFSAYVDEMVVITSITLLLAHHLFSFAFRLYRRVWRYASIEELLGIFAVVSCSIALTAIVQSIVYDNVYLRGLSLAFMLHILLIGGVRFAWRVFKTIESKLTSNRSKNPKKRTLIIGAGSTGRMLVSQLREHADSVLEPVMFLDDKEQFQKLTISGIRVKGKLADLKNVVNKYKIEHIVIAIPSLSKAKLNEIVTVASDLNKNVQILPFIEDIALGNISVNHIRDVSIVDLLGRDPVELGLKAISEKVAGETIVVTGAGGSIGSELCRQLASFKPKEIILLGHGEYSIYSIEMELKHRYPRIEFITEIADIQDRERIFQVMEAHRPKFVFHAAAHKHVPLMERNPQEAVKNNVYGTKNVAEAAHHCNVDTFVLISTDKAVNPTSVMGATKRIAEMAVQDLAKMSKTCFVVVRFGNVLGSNGSVIPLFKKQIEAGGPVTVTHPDMERYFMTIPEASRLVIQASSIAKGGEIFVLDMGEPVKIIDLARNLIKLSGFSEDEIDIQITGIRPGEKLYEELLNEDEVHPEQVYPKIYIGKSVPANISYILNELEKVDSKEELKKRLLYFANSKEITEKVQYELV